MNIYNNKIIKPSDGVYLTKTSVNNKEYYSMTYIASDIIESYLLDYNKFRYKMKIKVDFFQKIRDNMIFNNHTLLIQQLNKDLIKLKEFAKIGELNDYN